MRMVHTVQYSTVRYSTYRRDYSTVHVLHGSKERKVSHLSNSPSIDIRGRGRGRGCRKRPPALLDPEICDLRPAGKIRVCTRGREGLIPSKSAIAGRHSSCFLSSCPRTRSLRASRFQAMLAAASKLLLSYGSCSFLACLCSSHS